ncbi:hypothetical protein [Aeoliella sp.]|uniref:hypothetical protein n=1 Tax=Aeoliella sp. TaxID=2795800 RepID=UPI003CCBD184
MLTRCTIPFALVAALAASIVTPAAAQIRIKLGDDFKPRIELKPDDGGRNKVGDHRWRGDDEHKDDGHRRGGQENWVIRPGGGNSKVQITPNIGGRDATFVIRSGTSKGHHHGSYYCRGDKYYYVPWVDHSHHRHVEPQPVVIAFGGYSHVDELTLELETQMNNLCLDLHYNYQHNPGFHETYSEAYELFQTAKFILAAEHRNDRQAVRSRLGGMDALFHHVEGDVHGWSRHHQRQIGQSGLQAKFEQVEATLHHLMYDVGVHPTPVREEAPPPSGYIEQAPPPAAPPTAPTPAPPTAPPGGVPTAVESR